MEIDKKQIKKILLISLTNIGDVVLTFPVIDILRTDFPEANISLVIGPKSKTLLHNNPHFQKVYLFNKKQNFLKSFLWICELKKEKFDLVLDLRNTAIPFFLFPKYRASFLMRKPSLGHMRDKHLNRLRTVHTYDVDVNRPSLLRISSSELQQLTVLLEKKLDMGDRYVVIAPGSASSEKQWNEKGFAQISDHIIEKYDCKVVFIGDDKDRLVGERIIDLMQYQALNFCGQTTLIQAAELIKFCLLAIVNDSAPMHLASYLDKPIIAIFGPSDPEKYGPWSKKSRYLRDNSRCEKCSDEKKDVKHTCINAIHYSDVLSAFSIDGDVVAIR